VTGVGAPPEATLFVLAYRQEAHVRAAIEGAFAQTLAPLEIILSDDCSPDGTFAVMQEMAAAYAGPHRVVLNRNPVNLGLIGHVNRVMQLATADFVIQNAGDDVSLPERAERLVAAWRAGRGEVMAVHSAARRIEADGSVADYPPKLPVREDLGPRDVIEDGFHLIGASMGWSRRLFEVFGPLSPAALIEDRPLAFRASLLGRIAWIDAPLLLYRAGGESDPASLARAAFQPLSQSYHIKRQRWHRSFHRSYLADMETVAPPDYEACRRRCEEELAALDFEIALAEAGFAGRLGRLPQAIRMAAARRDARALRTQAKYLLERPYRLVRGLRARRRVAS
jgi:glycosyltransferase involved in cell wall biosynthesis